MGTLILTGARPSFSVETPPVWPLHCSGYYEVAVPQHAPFSCNVFEEMKKILRLKQREDSHEAAGDLQTERRGRLAGPDRRLQVLQAAASQFAKTGLRGTTTRTLARAAGVPTPT